MQFGKYTPMQPEAQLAQILVQTLRPTRPMVILDVETTGTDAEQDHVVELGMFVVRPDATFATYELRFNPGCPIPPGATAVHGITDADVANEAPFAKSAPKIHRLLTEYDVIGFNVRRFDVRILAAEVRRAGFEINAEQVTVIDAMGIFHAKEPRDLSAAARFYVGEEHRDAHHALADVMMTAAVFVGQLQRYPELNSVEACAKLSHQRDPSWLDYEGKIAWIDGAARFTFGKHKGRRLSDVPDYLRWLLSGDFGPSTKALAQRVLRGETIGKPEGVE